MNYISCIIQVLEIPEIMLYNNSIPMVIFRTKLPYVRNRIGPVIIVKSVIWGNLAYDFINYYSVNDYILIEGYVSTSLNDTINPLEINIIKFYPFLLQIERID